MSLALVALLYWAVGWVFFLKKGDLEEIRMLANISSFEDSLQDQCGEIGVESGQDKFCSFETKKRVKGQSVTVKSTIRLWEKDDSDKEVGVRIVHRIKGGPDSLTEAGFCGTDRCSKVHSADIENISDTISEILALADEEIDEELNNTYETAEQEEIDERIANCEIGKESTVSDIIEISTEERRECKIDKVIDKLAKAEPVQRTNMFHYELKELIWQMVSQDSVRQNFFLEEYKKKLSIPSLFGDNQIFSVQSAMDLMSRYNDFRLFTEQMEAQKKSFTNQMFHLLPGYFSMNTDNKFGRQDKEFMREAWMRNFLKYDFPDFDLIFTKESERRTRRTKKESRELLRRWFGGDYTRV